MFHKSQPFLENFVCKTSHKSYKNDHEIQKLPSTFSWDITIIETDFAVFVIFILILCKEADLSTIKITVPNQYMTLSTIQQLDH